MIEMSEAVNRVFYVSEVTRMVAAKISQAFDDFTSIFDPREHSTSYRGENDRLSGSLQHSFVVSLLNRIRRDVTVWGTVFDTQLSHPSCASEVDPASGGQMRHPYVPPAPCTPLARVVRLPFAAGPVFDDHYVVSKAVCVQYRHA